MFVAPHTPAASPALTDPFGRTITYLRLSVTDRCDLRCTYCMAEDMRFFPKTEVLDLDELARVALAFVRLGVRKIRLTGGEPLVRRGVMGLVERLGAQVRAGVLDEVTLTTNATQIHRFAGDLARAGVRRINVSLDSLRPDVFARVTRGGDLNAVLAGIDAARAAGLFVKINTVALARDNADELEDIIAWAHDGGMDTTLIEVMPMGDVTGDRRDQFLSLMGVREALAARWTLTDLDLTTGGPSRYVRVEETGGRLGFITPLSENFCAGCNRVRVTCTGQMFMCLGRNDQVDLRAVLRADSHDVSASDAGSSDGHLQAAIIAAMSHKPERHDFERALAVGEAAVPRRMSDTGG